MKFNVYRHFAFVWAFSFLNAKKCISVASTCISVSNWNDFKTAVKNAAADSNLVFCPFKISKSETAQVTITRSIDISCMEEKECTIVGKGNHIRVRRRATSFVLSGFVLVGASENALRFDKMTSQNQHKIKNCVFRSNHGPLAKEGRGGALRIEIGNNVTIVNTRFVDNQAFFGGAVIIYGGEVKFISCIFIGNLGARGSSMHITSSDALVKVSQTSFLSNAATKGNNGVIQTVSPDALYMLAGTKGTNNDGCNGAYDTSSKTCIPFPDILVPPALSIGDLASGVQSEGVRFSKGLSARVIARSGEPVVFTSPEAKTLLSEISFHLEPDGAAVFDIDGGGYIFVSNSEEPHGKGGVYGLEFDQRGYVRDYKPLMENTSRNCNGGKTPWQTWVSCEEIPQGQCYQVDPKKKTQPEKTELGGIGGGSFEAFAYDNSNPSAPQYFVTEDVSNGALRRFRPTPGMDSGWSMLHDSNGTLDYLEFLPENKFRWTSSLSKGRESAMKYYRNTEGITYHNRALMFVSKVQKELFRLDLDAMTYTVESTQTGSLKGGGSFGSGPDHLLATSGGLLYFTEDGGSTPGVFVYDGTGYKAFLEADSPRYVGDETTGIAFTPDMKKFLFCLQEAGVCFQVERMDGRAFPSNHRVLKWKYSR